MNYYDIFRKYKRFLLTFDSRAWNISSTLWARAKRNDVGTFKGMFESIFWIFIVTCKPFSTKIASTARHVRPIVRISCAFWNYRSLIYKTICKPQAERDTRWRILRDIERRTGPVITHLHSFQCRATFSRGRIGNWYSSLAFFDLSAAPITAISLMYRIME